MTLMIFRSRSIQVHNTVGANRTTIILQRKGPPERPEMVNAIAVGHNSILLQWIPGFDGGIHKTGYLVAYKQIASPTENDVSNDCYSPRRNVAGDSWYEIDCQRNNPCNVSMLEQYQPYVFKVSKTIVERI